MAPPLANLHLDVEAISGICGSISIACWVIVFTPQLIANWRSSSAEALSIQFIIVWLIGDVFNIAGAVLQGVLPTMIILAVYYTLADIVLLGQCFYYRGFTLRDEPTTPTTKPNGNGNGNGNANEHTALLGDTDHHERRGSDWTGLSPAVPHMSHTEPPPPPPSVLQTVVWNAAIVFMVCTAGVLGWFLGQHATGGEKERPAGGEDALEFSTWGQFFGYLCAVFYIASRVPQLILNYRRKTTEGLSMLFFIFACLGNVTYVLSIFAYEPHCKHHKCTPGEAGRIYGKYILVNLSWLAGALVTLIMDLVVFGQYFYYSRNDQDECAVSNEERHASGRQRRPERADVSYDQRPLLQRGDSGNP
ncbi:putative vacuolar membrane transporter for cationic amino acids [Conoideocrella luteorostrata]|uniref:Vacuolar membrane transporter for cationic amino acids n=1 Tax=Conoideocrella luteorostrata TaxID=1105319 RepID=A0AAJ0FQZ1_9HYPO|nr:putative vacuolar membrane transporter for cationic amino acids [Conoideocrella luteorostrata]